MYFDRNELWGALCAPKRLTCLHVSHKDIRGSRRRIRERKCSIGVKICISAYFYPHSDFHRCKREMIEA